MKKKEISELEFQGLVNQYKGIMVKEMNNAIRNLQYRDGNTVTRDDAWQECLIALYYAYNGFDESKGFEFTTYLTWIVRHRLYDYCRTYSRGYSIPQKLNTLLCKCDKLLNKGMTYEEIGKELGVSAKKVEETLAHNNSFMSLDRNISSDVDLKNERFVSTDDIEKETEDPRTEIIRDVINSAKASEGKDMFIVYYGINNNLERITMNQLKDMYPEYSESTIRRRLKEFQASIMPNIRTQLGLYKGAAV